MRVDDEPYDDKQGSGQYPMPPDEKGDTHYKTIAKRPLLRRSKHLWLWRAVCIAVVTKITYAKPYITSL